MRVITKNLPLHHENAVCQLENASHGNSNFERAIKCSIHHKCSTKTCLAICTCVCLCKASWQQLDNDNSLGPVSMKLVFIKQVKKSTKAITGDTYASFILEGCCSLAIICIDIQCITGPFKRPYTAGDRRKGHGNNLEGLLTCPNLVGVDATSGRFNNKMRVQMPAHED